MSQRVVYFNGRIVPESEAKVSIFDSALQLGDMAFEVTRTYHGEPYRLRDHLRRLWNSMTALAIDLTIHGTALSADELERVTHEVLTQNRATEAFDVDWNIIHDVSRGPAGGFRSAFAAEDLRPTVIVACYPIVEKMAALAPAYEWGIDLVVPQQRSLPDDLFDASIKCRSRAHYQLANLQADRIHRGATAVLLDPAGFVTEGTSGNVFFVRGGRLMTPAARNILPGITRGVVLELAAKIGIEAVETDVALAEALAAEEIFVTSTSIGILHARTFEGLTVGNGRLGPIAAQLRAALTLEVGLDFAAQAQAYAAKVRA